MADSGTTLRNRMTGEERSLESLDDLRSAYREFADPGRNLRVLLRKQVRRFSGRGDRAKDDTNAAP